MNINLLKGKMAEKSMSQSKLAQTIGISENSLSRKFLGKREFRLSEVVAICNALNLTEPEKIFFTSCNPKMQRIACKGKINE